MFYFVEMALTVADLIEHSVDAVPDRLALVTGVGALVSVICNPLFGAFSDASGASSTTPRRRT